jgi:hypothetical protein
MDDNQFSQLTKKLDFISNVLLINIVKDMEFKKQVETLHQIGLTEVEIVKFLKSTRDKVHSITRKLQ